MNIFVLDSDPHAAAEAQCDKHVVKMILESAQILSTVCSQHGLAAPYKATHAHHPCTRWASESAENYRWLWEHLQGLLKAYSDRYGKTHLVERNQYLQQLWEGRPMLPAIGLTAFAQVMPEDYRVPEDAVAAYRRYYLADKSRFARWRNGQIPEWYQAGLAAGPAELHA